MGMWKTFWDFLGVKSSKKDTYTYIEASTAKDMKSISDLAYEICVERIAKAICKCEFRTFKKGKEVKEEIYYRLNERPNDNQTATEFWQELVERLYKNQEALIIETGDKLYIAESWLADDKVLGPRTFRDIQIGKLTLNKVYRADEVAYLKLSNQNVKKYLTSVLDSYTKMLATASMAYQNSVGIKAKLHVNNPKIANDEKSMKAIQTGVKKFFDDPNSVFVENDGYDFAPFDTSRKGTQQSTRDIKAMLDDVLELTSKAFLIPGNIANGEVTDTSKAVDDFLTFCLDSVISLLEDGLNNCLFGFRGWKAGNKVKINSQTIKHVDILDASSAIDKLIGCGAKSINDVLRITGDEPIDEEWADKHWMTKNYMDIANMQDLSIAEKGGSKDENEEPVVPDESESG